MRKSISVLLLTALALGACRREEPVPLKEDSPFSLHRLI